ncbi:MAG TPA: hypothetical protein PKA51_07280 [Kiritimatiellia bacterium]|nr:hypothetical protein [Kiritimatiellia bacterium]
MGPAWLLPTATEAWLVPVNFTVEQLPKVCGQIFQFAVGVRYWADSPNNGPEDWGLPATLTFLFPRGVTRGSRRLA